MTTPKDTLLKQLAAVDKMPSLPVVVAPLLRYLEQPVDRLDLQKVVGLLSHDKSLTAQILHMANSPLFGFYQQIDTIRGAVVALGFQRLRDIVVSCSLLKLNPPDSSSFAPTVFWEHSLGCALVARHFARKIDFPEAEKAYLAGLLHDLGVLVNLWLLPKEFAQALDLARAQGIPLHEAENATLGINHCETGRILAERWTLSPDLIEVVRSHHNATEAQGYRDLVSLVSLSDLLCRMGEIGHGHVEIREVTFIEEPTFAVLVNECPALRSFDWARFTLELEGYLDEVRRLVRQLYSNN
jgi:HD-like signal output (HDOD) protein